MIDRHSIAPVKDHADFDGIRRYHHYAAVGEIAFVANQHFSHRVALSFFESLPRIEFRHCEIFPARHIGHF
jgi:hypothetical protein